MRKIYTLVAVAFLMLSTGEMFAQNFNDSKGGTPSTQNGVTNDIEIVEGVNVNIYSFDKNVYVNIENINSTSEVSVYDIQGKRIALRNANTGLTSINLENKTGFYIVVVKTNEQVYTKKLYID